jgi:hypothetical protein
VGEWSRKSFFLEVTLSSGQVEWSASLGSHSFEVHSFEQFQRMLHFGGWCRTIISIRNGLDFLGFDFMALNQIVNMSPNGLRRGVANQDKIITEP